MESHPSNAPRYPMTLPHPQLPPVQTPASMPPINTSSTHAHTHTAVSHTSAPHHLAHVVHSHSLPPPQVHHQQHLAHHPMQQTHPMTPMSVNPSLIPVPHPHHMQPPHPGVHGPAQQPQHFYDQYAAERVVVLEAELEKARREIDSLRAKLAEYDKERAKTETPKAQSRYWTPDEHKRFLEALQEFGHKDVRSIANYVGSRNATQVRTHAQKYFLRIQREKNGGSALQAARKRSMSESDLARVGRAVGTPPGSPVMREGVRESAMRDAGREGVREGVREGLRSGQLPPPSSISGDTPMTPLPSAASLVSQRPSAAVASPARKPVTSSASQTSSAISIPAMMSTSSPPPVPIRASSALHHMQRDQQSAMSQKASSALANSGKPPPVSRAPKPPVSGPKISDSSGINLLSLVASEREMQSVKSKN